MGCSYFQQELRTADNNQESIVFDERLIYSVVRAATALGFSRPAVLSLSYQVRRLCSGDYIDPDSGLSYISDRLCQALLPHISAEQFLCELPVLIWRVCEIMRRSGLSHVLMDFQFQPGGVRRSQLSGVVLRAYPRFLGEFSVAVRQQIQSCYRDVFALALSHNLPHMLSYCLSWHCAFSLLSYASSHQEQSVFFLDILNSVMRSYRAQMGMEKTGLTVRYHLFRYSLGGMFRKESCRRLLPPRDRRSLYACAAPTRSWWLSRMQYADQLDSRVSQAGVF